MRSVAFVSLALLALAGPAAMPALAQTGPGAEAQNAAPAPAGQGQPAAPVAQPAPAPQAPQAATSPTTRIPVERRRGRTYARCNRAAYNRNLRGGARRRFLIRCSLGYERGIGQPGQPPAPVRKP